MDPDELALPDTVGAGVEEGWPDVDGDIELDTDTDVEPEGLADVLGEESDEGLSDDCDELEGWADRVGCADRAALGV